ncbi:MULTISPECIES: DUF3137 domain-containing protein [unclassified Sulfurospirillum]|uniref:DUF3137 domain-containing protein n=1 Tax=unclassified Sulfurospirillum TaxID=2618290 RepID=UPI00050593D0|nr:MULTISPECIES: DUF3137 domain-containing protein [unclassified Sulfurospirillum]KFL33765.1 hypothetical protein JU57_09505 [Sulfurospirillum sp. SCADC]
MKPRLSSLLDYYYESMYPSLHALEGKRLAILSTLKKAALLLVTLGTVLFFVLSRTNVFTSLHAFLLSVMSGFLIFMFIYRHERAGYGSLFKDLVIEKIIHFVDPSLIYTKMDSIDERTYRQSELFMEAYDRFSGKDLVCGEIEGVKIRFCDLHVEKKVRTKNGKEEWSDIFSGLFFVADFNKTFHSKVVVLPDVAERNLGIVGTWLQGVNPSRGALIKLDHVAFEKLFVVYGDDPIESRYILSHALMERIVDFHHKIDKPLYLSFVDSKLFLALHYTKPLFEPILARSLLEFESIKAYCELLVMITNIVTEFKLNEKLWSKR